MQTFPRIITTNYNRILSAADRTRPVYDLTDPRNDPADAYVQETAILHLHGCWNPKESADEKRDRIFRYVDPKKDNSPGPTLVLTENQYHRLYAYSKDFQRIVHRLFFGDELLLFIGSGLSADELGIHAYLRDLQLSYQSGPIGIYVGFDLNPAKVAFLKARNLAAIDLSGQYGWKPRMMEAIWHAFFDALEE